MENNQSKNKNLSPRINTSHGNIIPICLVKFVFNWHLDDNQKKM